jgi:glutathione peroxidase
MMKKKRSLATFGLATAVLLSTAAGWMLLDFPGRDFIADALGPIATLSDASSDDAAGDALVPDNGERFLPLPPQLEDDRVVEAIGPLARLACHRDDPDTLPTPDADAKTTAGTLDAPLASYSPDAQRAATAPLLAAAVQPLAPLAAAPSPEAARAAAADADTPADCPALLRQRFNRLQTGESQSLCQFRGKVLLVVNTASYCSYTSQYEALEALYRRYKGRGLVVVGFPSNDFGGQEPGTNQQIAQFCRLTYGVQFPMFEKSSVTQVASNPLFAALGAKTGVAPKWNFYKYVVDRKGEPVAGFPSGTTPDSRELVELIEALLAERPPV